MAPRPTAAAPPCPTAPCAAEPFEAWVAPHLPHAWRYARSLGCTAMDADDAVQDALLRLATLPRDRPAALGVRTWLCREVRSRASTRRRAARRRRSRERCAARPERAYAPVATAEDWPRIQRALARLPVTEREAVTLRFLHDLDYAQVAVVLGISPGACRQRVHRGIQRLRRDLGQAPSLRVGALAPPMAVGASVAAPAAGAGVSGPGTVFLGGLALSTSKTSMVIAALLALGIGIGGTLAIQHLLASPTPASGAASRARVQAQDAEIERLQRELRRARSSQDASLVGARDGSRDDGPSHAPPAETTAPAAPVGLAAKALGERWRRVLLDRADEDRRTRTWREVVAALRGDDRLRLLAALHAVRFTPPRGDLDRTGVAERLYELTRSEDEWLRAEAWGARVTIESRLVGAGHDPEGIPVDPVVLMEDVRRSTARTRGMVMAHLVSAWRREVPDRHQAFVQSLLQDAERAPETLRGLASATHIGEDILRSVLALADRDASCKAGVIQGVLLAQAHKGETLVTWILGEVEAGTPHALALLRQGVASDVGPMAGAHLRRLHDREDDPRVRWQLVSAVGHVGDVSSRAWLKSLAEDASDPGQQFAAQVALRSLDRAEGRRTRR